jgi:hypothetical protein
MIYECPKCGNEKNARDWQTCKNHDKGIGMYLVMARSKSERLATRNKDLKKVELSENNGV